MMDGSGNAKKKTKRKEYGDGIWTYKGWNEAIEEDIKKALYGDDNNLASFISPASPTFLIGTHLVNL